MSGAAPIRVFVADYHPVTIEGLRVLCATTDDLVVVGGVTRRPDLWPAVRATPFDVLLIDVVRLGGVALLTELVATYPGAVVLFTDLYDFSAPLLAAGAAGYISKSDPAARQRDALRVVGRGGQARSPEADDCWQWFIVQGKGGRSPAQEQA